MGNHGKGYVIIFPFLRQLTFSWYFVDMKRCCSSVNCQSSSLGDDKRNFQSKKGPKTDNLILRVRNGFLKFCKESFCPRMAKGKIGFRFQVKIYGHKTFTHRYSPKFYTFYIYGLRIPAHPVSEKFEKYFIHRSHDLPVTPVLHWHCPAVSFVHTVPGIAPVVLQLHSEI